MAHTPLLTMLQQAASEIAAEDDGTERRDETGVPAAFAATISCWSSSGRRGGRGRGASATRRPLRRPPAHESSSSAVVWPARPSRTSCARPGTWQRSTKLRQTVLEADAGRSTTTSPKDRSLTHGGELIDQGHTEMRQLAQSLDLKLDNLVAARPRAVLLSVVPFVELQAEQTGRVGAARCVLDRSTRPGAQRSVLWRSSRRSTNIDLQDALINFVDLCQVPGLAQLVRAGQPGQTTADDDDSWAGGRRNRRRVADAPPRRRRAGRCCSCKKSSPRGTLRHAGFWRRSVHQPVRRSP